MQGEKPASGCLCEACSLADAIWKWRRCGPISPACLLANDRSNCPLAAFKEALVLSNSEVAVLLERVRLSRAEQQGTGPNAQPLSPLVEKAQNYCDKFNCGKNVEAVSALRQ